jgi:1-acyl-sn-glycerol-3-phosphate acyltransferase
MRFVLAGLTFLIVTGILAPLVVIASLLRVREKPDSIYERAMRWWARSLCAAGGVKIRVHGEENLLRGKGAVYVANHVSWFDVFVLAAVLPRYTWVAKAELKKIPLFGRGAEAAGIIFIERENRKAAFESYRVASAEVAAGRAVIVCPEGTRGDDYPLRPFKKGPFVLAIAAQAPIVPTLVHGTKEVLPRGSLWVRAGTVDVHLLEPVYTAGCGYDDRQRIVEEVWTRMADALQENYGIASRGAHAAREREG